jgi:hypothetical protein
VFDMVPALSSDCFKYNPKRFGRWCRTLGIIGVLDFAIVLYSKEQDVSEMDFFSKHCSLLYIFLLSPVYKSGYTDVCCPVNEVSSF